MGKNRRVRIDVDEAVALARDARFTSKYDVEPSGCWVWKAGKTTGGYGQIWLTRSKVVAHRVSFVAQAMRDVPADLELDHLCRNRACVNPAHLEVVTRRVNVKRGDAPTARNARKTHCPQGHPLVSGNLRADKLRKGQRVCLTCHKRHGRANYDRLRAAQMATGLSSSEYRKQYGLGQRTARAILAKEMAR